MKPIEFLNLTHFFRENENSYLEAFKNVMTRGHFILGSEVQAFEKEFAEFLGCRHVLGTGNGLDAITISLKALDIGPGDEVIVPAHTFIATWLAVSAVGATLVPVEVDDLTMNIDLKKVEEKITDRTKAVIGVHLYGRPFEAIELRRLVDQHGLFLIEDAAQAHGAQLQNKKIGTIGHLATFSFYPGKNLGAYGDGGAVSTQDDNLARKVAMLRNYGSEVKYHHELMGGNSRLDELQAAFLRLRLKTLAKENLQREKIALLYQQNLHGIKGLHLPLPKIDGQQVWHLYVIRTPLRDALQKYLQEQKIPTLIHYPIPCHLSTCYENLRFKKGDFPVTEAISNQVLSLPMGPHLSMEQVVFICEKIKMFFTEQQIYSAKLTENSVFQASSCKT